MRFPVDVSGGVARFRHRRGNLQRLEVEVAARRIERWAAPRLRGVVGTRSPDVWIGVARSRAIVCVAAASRPEESCEAPLPAVAFDVHAVIEGEDLVLVVANARGVGLAAPATAIAVACVEAIVGDTARRQGAMFVFRRPAAALARALFPEAGARTPRADEVRWTAIATAGDTWVLQAIQGAVAAAPDGEAVVARQVAADLRAADDKLANGNLDEARNDCIDLLARAPGQPEISRRLIEIDASVEGRAEAALATLAAVRSRGHHGDANRAVRFGPTPGLLLYATGDLDAAVASLEHAADDEPAPALAARAFELAASASRDIDDAVRWLDRAIARWARSTTARWTRLEKRLALGRLEDALADAEHLEALADGATAKYAVWMRAGRAWQTAGLGTRAGMLFERALRYAPDEPEALAGLAAAMTSEGDAARGTALLARALELAEARGRPTAGITLDLACALAERLDDLPGAIARASAVAKDAIEAPIARGLEGRWRALLGDVAGAALAFARLRDFAASLPPTDDARTQRVVDLLVEAARTEETQRGDPLAAQRHLAEAVRLRPQDQGIRVRYREVCSSMLRGEPATDFESAEAASATHATAPSGGRALGIDLSLASESPGTADVDVDDDRARRVEELTKRLHADPADDAAAAELAGLLEALGRGHELLALLCARLEDASPERRAELTPRAREVLQRLAADADRAGRHDEAAMYRVAAAALVS
jgi:tetratricopeptide (TPR) repeat protein